MSSFLRITGIFLVYAVQGFLFTEPLPPAGVPAFIDACKQIAEESKVIDLTTVRKKIASKSFA